MTQLIQFVRAVLTFFYNYCKIHSVKKTTVIYCVILLLMCVNAADGIRALIFQVSGYTLIICVCGRACVCADGL